VKNESQDILTLQDVCAYLRVHEMTIYRWVKAGILPGSKIGGRWRFKKSHIEKCFSEKMTVRL